MEQPDKGATVSKHYKYKLSQGICEGCKVSPKITGKDQNNFLKLIVIHIR